jgi:hypothetical protein
MLPLPRIKPQSQAHSLILYKLCYEVVGTVGMGLFLEKSTPNEKKEHFTAIKMHHGYYTDSLVLGPSTHFANLFYSPEPMG